MAGTTLRDVGIGIAVGIGGYYFLRKKYPETIPALSRLQAINQKLLKENTILRRFTNERLQQLAGVIPDPYERQRNYGAMPFEQHPEKTARESQFGFMSGYGSRIPSSYNLFGMADEVNTNPPPGNRPGTIIQRPPVTSPATSEAEWQRHREYIGQKQMNAVERQFTYGMMGDYKPVSNSAAIFGMN